MTLPPMPVSTHIQPLPDLVNVLQDAIQRSLTLDKPVLVSMITSWEPLNLLDLFQRAEQLALTRMYWSAPDSSLDMIGFGETQRLIGRGEDRFQQIMDDWHRLLEDRITVSQDDVGTDPTGPVLLGGFSFFSQDTSDGATGDVDADQDPWWADFSDGLMVCPQLLITQTQTKTWLTQNSWVSATSDPNLVAQQMTDLLKSIVEEPHPPAEQALIGTDHPVVRDDHGGRIDVSMTSQVQTETRFKQLVEQATAALGDGDLKKIVIAESTDVSGSRPFHPALVLSALGDEYPGCTRFAVGLGPRTFVGATPERLVSLSDQYVKVTCLAGSAPRGQNPVEDRALGQALLNDPKNLVEHNWVIHMVRQALNPLCSRLDIASQPTLLTLKNVQHLYTPVEGLVDAETPVNILTLVRSLHPTPAVGGFPQAASSHWLKQHEAIDRGWYAAPVGWMAPNGNGEFVVAIRSGIICGDRARLFAGCGIVAGSEQHAEFLESQLKLAPMLRALRRSLG